MFRKIFSVIFASIMLLSIGSLVLASDQSGEGSRPAQDQDCAIDLMLVLDSSGSIAPPDYTTMKSWAIELISRFTLGTEDARVGVAQFDTASRLVVGLSDDEATVNGAINNMYQLGGSTNITSGLFTAQEQFQLHGREGAPRVIILLTDGNHNEGPEPLSYAEEIRIGEETGGGTTILGVAVGSFTLTQINAIAGGEHNVVQVPDFESLQHILSILHDYSCAVATEGTVSSSSLPAAEVNNAPAQPATAVPPASSNSSSQPTATPAPTIAPPAVVSGDCTIHSIITERVNLRTGPGLGQVWIGFLPVGREHPVIGQARDNENVTWWKLADGAWVRHDIVGETGDCASVPVVNS